MKRGGPWHPKTQRLALALEVPLCTAVGLLEMLWHCTAQYAPAGDVGRFTNVEIGLHLRWPGAADPLVDALVFAGFLDPSPTYRLIVHDWHEHADQTTQRALARRGESFVTLRKGKRKVASSKLENSSLVRGKGVGAPVERSEDALSRAPQRNATNDAARLPSNKAQTVAASTAAANTHLPTNAVSSSSATTDKTSARSSMGLEAGFDDWWPHYGRKEAKADARKAWRQMAGERPDLATLLRALSWQRPLWAQKERQYTPLPGSYLRGERWNDEPPPGTRMPGPTEKPLSEIKVSPLAARLNAMGKKEMAHG